MSDIRFEGWLHRSGTGGVYQDSAGNVGIASTQPKTRLDIQNGAFQIGPAGICTATTVNTTNLINATPLSHRNLIINGAMNVAQRGTTSTSTGIKTVDRFGMTASGTDETPTQSTFDVSAPSSPYHLPTSGAHPYKEGFRKAYGLTNGNQTGGAGTTDRVNIYYNVEAQDLANSGWDYTDPNSYITLSYWIKSSVAQNFYHRMYSYDGTAQGYCWETGTLTAFTWTKITKKIPGNANLTFDNNNDAGLYIVFAAYSGTNYTNDKSLDSWAAFASDNRFPTFPTTWYTTNDASVQITGVQLELGSVATPFEHRSYGDELARCGRYYQKLVDANTKALGIGMAYNGSTFQIVMEYPLGAMRTVPSIDAETGADYWKVEGGGVSLNIDGSWVAEHITTTQMSLYGVPDGTLSTIGLSHYCRSNNAAAKFAFLAEL